MEELKENRAGRGGDWRASERVEGRRGERVRERLRERLRRGRGAARSSEEAGGAEWCNETEAGVL